MEINEKSNHFLNFFSGKNVPRFINIWKNTKYLGNLSAQNGSFAYSVIFYPLKQCSEYGTVYFIMAQA